MQFTVAQRPATVWKLWPPAILDRYMLSELGGTFFFGISAFTLILAAASILNIEKLVATERAPLWAAVEVFLWQLPGIFVLAIPMALLLGTLLAMQRLSGESEIVAMKAGGIAFTRIIAPLLLFGIFMSFVMLFLQEEIVPLAADEQTYLLNDVIQHQSAFSHDLTVSAPLPGGGRQMTVARSIDKSGALLKVTIIQYNSQDKPTQILFADRAVFTADRWQLENMSAYAFGADGVIDSQPAVASTQVDIGQKPTELIKRATHNNPQDMSRAQIADIIRSGQLNESELRKYTATYHQKLALPFSCFVFMLIAIPFGVRATRGGGSAGIGFGLAVAIVFVYYVVLTVFSYIGDASLTFAPLTAWLPNILFTYFGVQRLRKAAAT